MSIITTRDKDSLRKVTRYGNERSYVLDGEEYPSVTRIIGGGEPKPALTKWAARVTAEAAVNGFSLFKDLMEDSPQGGLDWLMKAMDRSKDGAAHSGTLIHDWFEARILGTPLPDLGDDPRAVATVGHVDHFLETVPIEWIAVEAVVYQPAGDDIPTPYAGTLDAIGIFGQDADVPEGWKGVPMMIDLKSGKAVYGGAAAQCAAYRWAPWMIDQDGDVIGTPPTDAAVVLHITPDGWTIVPVQTGKSILEVFNSMSVLADWSKWKGGSMESVGEGMLAGRQVPKVMPNALDLSAGRGGEPAEPAAPVRMVGG